MTWLWFLFFLPLTLLTIGWFGWNYYYDWNSAGWPVSQGRVEHCTVDEHETYEDDGSVNYSFSLDVTFSYQVDGVSYGGQRFSFDPLPRRMSASDFDTETERYKEGAEVEVYTKPDEPEVAVLRPRASSFFRILFGLLINGVVIWLALATAPFYFPRR